MYVCVCVVFLNFFLVDSFELKTSLKIKIK